MSTTQFGKRRRSAASLDHQVDEEHNGKGLLRPESSNQKVRKTPLSGFRLRRLGTESSKRTNDDIHSSIHLCPVSWALIDTPYFQRLHEIRQLGTADRVYMNVRHKRFEHSIGVAHLAERMCRRIHDRQPGLTGGAGGRGEADRDVLCVKLAGLLHDLGHGPFSHDFEDFVKRAMPEHLETLPAEIRERYEKDLPPLPKDWSHEHVALEMIDAMLTYLGLRIDLENLDLPLEQIGDGVEAKSMRVFKRSPLSGSVDRSNSGNPEADYAAILTSRDFVFIKECIWGGPIPEINERLGLAVGSFVGRPDREKEWLYNIVSNYLSGLDVDKVDYYARDDRPAFRGAGEIDKVIVEEASVAWAKCTNPAGFCHRCRDPARPGDPRVGQHLMICYPDKLVSACMGFFKHRYELHSTIYRHKKTQASAFMITDILKLADPYFRGLSTAPHPFYRDHSAGQPKAGVWERLPASRAMLDGNAFLRLDDSIIRLIDNETGDPNLRRAQELIARWKEHEFYKCVEECLINGRNPASRRLWEKTERQIKEEMLSVRGRHGAGEILEGNRAAAADAAAVVSLDRDDFIIEKCSIHHGCKDENPLNRMRFLTKEKMIQLALPVWDLPEAVQKEEHELEAQLPRALEQRKIRVFSRHPSKNGLVSHVFRQWLEGILGEIRLTPALPPEHASPQRDENNRDNQPGMAHRSPVVLSQENYDSDSSDCDEQNVTWMSPTGIKIKPRLA